jgi:uncharacterized protein YkwD
MVQTTINRKRVGFNSRALGPDRGPVALVSAACGRPDLRPRPKKHSPTLRRLAAVLLAGGVAALGLGCSAPKSEGAQPGAVDVSSLAMKAPDFDARPASGGPRTASGDGETQVGGETVSVAMSAAAASAEDEFLTLTNQRRQEIGVAAVTRDASLDNYARAHAAAMAGARAIYHSDITKLLAGWWIVGENVGVGPDAPAIEAAYVASPSHYRNLTNATFLYTGLGVYIDASGRIWTAQEFAA